MKLPSRRKIATIALRLWTIVTRFFLVFFLARFLSPNDVGLYGLIAATAGYVVYILGMDMYSYTTREILRSEPRHWRSYVASHSTFISLVYLLVLPLLLVLFSGSLLPWSVAVWFYLIAVTEHLGLELDRILVATSKQLSASLVVFVRQAMLPTFIIPLLALIPSAREISTVLMCWVGFNIVAIAMGATLLHRALSTSDAHHVDWRWIRRGFGISTIFFIGTLLLRILFTADRQIVAWFDGLDALGAYTVAMSLGTGLSSVLSVAVHQFLYPTLVTAAHQQDRVAFRRGVRTMLVQTLALSGLAILFVVVFRDTLTSWIGGGIYSQFSWLFLTAVLIMALYNLSLVPHYMLYAYRADRAILTSTAASVALFLTVIVVSMSSGIEAVNAVVTGLAAASAVLLVMKSILAITTIRRAWAGPADLR